MNIRIITLRFFLTSAFMFGAIGSGVACLGGDAQAAVPVQQPGQSGTGASPMSSPADSDGAAGISTTGDTDAAAEAVKKRFAARFAGTPVTAVRRTPYGLYEVQLGMDLVYTDEHVTWVMEGPLIDAATRRDVTQEHQEALGRVPFDQLPKQLAIKQVKGRGTRQIAIFEDPNCGYCKQLHQTLENVDDITVYTFLYPILAPDSKTKSRDVWCAKNQGMVWDDWMVKGKLPAQTNCVAPTDKVLALGQKLMVRGTPTIFFTDGSRVSGALPLDQLQEKLKSATIKE
jgi:thiol:disulfide interchange protein DsbC